MIIYYKRVSSRIWKRFTCLGENTENITFSVLIENEVTIVDKKWNGITKTRSYSLQSFHSKRFTASSLLHLVNNLAEGIHKIECK